MKMCEASEPKVAGDTCTLPKVRNSPVCVVDVRTEGVLVSGCWREAKQY